MLSFANFIESIILYEKLYVDEYSYERLIRRIADGFVDKSYEQSIRGALESIFGDEWLVATLPSTEPERRSVSEHANSIGSLVDLRKAYSNLFDLCPSLQRELKISEFTSLESSFLTDESSEGGETSIASPSDVLFFENHKISGLLNDCAFRAWYYLSLAMQKGIIYVPNDFRALFLPSHLIHKSSSAIILKKLEKEFDTKVEENASWFEDPIPDVKIHFPLIFNYIMSKLSEKSKASDILRLALEVRNSDPAHKFREICKTLDQARKDGDMKTQIRMTKEIDEQLQNISKLQDSKSSFNVTLSFPPSISFPVGSDMIGTVKNLKRNRNFIFLRNVFDGSTDPRHILDAPRLDILRGNW